MKQPRRPISLAHTPEESGLDRLVHNAYRLELRGESQRKTRSSLPMPTT
jgi:hypothetical protein